jgi:hypothetical protein
MEAIPFQLVYDGKGPAIWTPAPGAFGLQDKAGVLHVGTPGAGGAVVFDFTLQVKAMDADAVVFTGDFAHGKPAERFVYLGWRNAAGGFAQRLKLPLSTITPGQVREAIAQGTRLTATLLDAHPKATSTGANVGGTRPLAWTLA